jgi:hypothetical protein
MKTHLFSTILLALGGLFMMANPVDAQTTISITNSSMWDIYHVYISAADESDWGDDLLGDTDVLETGETVRFTFLSTGRYDIKVIDEDGDECIMWGVYLQNDETWTITDESHLECIDDSGGFDQPASTSGDASLTISNTCMWDIYNVYISNADDSEWGEDLLGDSDILETGETRRFYLGGSGNYDIKLVDEDGDECMMWNVSINGAETLTITDESHLECIN